jgi:hypothetical protein
VYQITRLLIEDNRRGSDTKIDAEDSEIKKKIEGREDRDGGKERKKPKKKKKTKGEKRCQFNV